MTRTRAGRHRPARTTEGPVTPPGPRPEEPAGGQRRAAVVVVSFFAAVFFLISLATLAQKTPTVDEPLHLFGGYAYLKWSDYRANPVTPPLAKLWAALPLLAFEIKDPRTPRPHWSALRQGSEDAPLVDIARDMFFVDNDGAPLFAAAKRQMIVLGVLLGVSIFFCARRLFGFEAGVAALALFSLDPNMLAHSQVVHGDVPFALVFFLATYLFWRFLDRVSWATAIGAACFIAIAPVTKFTYAALMPTLLILAAMRILSSRPQQVAIGAPRLAASRREKALLSAALLAVSAIAAYAAIWAAYGFHFDAIPGGASPLPMQAVLPASGSLLRPLAEFAAGYRLFPEAWIYGQLSVWHDLGRTAYLLGEMGTGFWSYFPVAFAVKTPLPMQMLVAAGLWLLAARRLDRLTGWFLLVPVAVCFLAAVSSRMNIGLRHILVIYPFLFVLAGGAAGVLWRRGARTTRWAVAILALWSVTACAWTYPHYLAYFNKLAGGPENGHKVLLDSNLDWGQDLKGLQRWMEDHGVPRIEFLYFGTVDPEFYGIDATYIPGNWVNWDPPATRAADPPRYIAISAHLLFTDWREAYVKAYRAKRPVATIGHSIFVFDREAEGR